ncbi:MAG: TIGR03790 family protein, partial [Verrucomicrobiales bacterium]|nr:TIGR03790 family protein [Verrucomicrobiales bacterium]
DGAQVVVVYNTAMRESREVAEHYAQRRGVPSKQVWGLKLPTVEEITWKEYLEGLERPLLRKLEDAGLWRFGPAEAATNGAPLGARKGERVVDARSRYLVLCYGVPLRIAHDANLDDPGAVALRPEFKNNGAAVDAELACLPQARNAPVRAGPRHNPLYTTTNAPLLHPTNHILLVARLDGPTPDLARALVDKALEAETEGLWGRAYFDVRNVTEPGLKQGDDWIRGAAEICRHLGYETVVDTGGDTFPPGFPMSHIAFYAGWYREHVSGPLAAAQVEFMPGAFAYHLHSFSAVTLRATNRAWVGPLLARGVACTFGSVHEPYLGGTPDVGVFAGRFLFYGFTFGEAAYAAQPVLSWQTTVVGDPLYRPWGRSLTERIREQLLRGGRRLEWGHLQLVNFQLANGAPLAEAVRYLENQDITRKSAVLTEKLGDLYAAQGKPSSAVFTWQQALKLNPSPQQRLRLRLALAEKLAALNRDEELYENYQRLLEETPGYPDTPAIARKLLTLAEKLGRAEDAAKYRALTNSASRTNGP